MRPSIPSDPPAVRPVILLHQEGVLGLLAIGGLALREQGPLASLAPVGGMGISILAGVAGGLGASLALWLVRALFPGAGKASEAPGRGEPTAGEILARRYARGEIDQTEYHLMKETLADKSE